MHTYDVTLTISADGETMYSKQYVVRAESSDVAIRIARRKLGHLPPHYEVEDAAATQHAPLVPLGMAETSAIDDELQLDRAHVAADWLMEEAAELLGAANEAEQLDAYLDALGIILYNLVFYKKSALRSAFAEYGESQSRRGRQPGWWHFAIGRLLADVPEEGTEAWSSSQKVYMRRRTEGPRGMQRARAAIDVAVAAEIAKHIARKGA